MAEQETPRVAPQGVKEYSEAIEAAEAAYAAALVQLDAKYPQRDAYGSTDSEGYKQYQAWREEQADAGAADDATKTTAWDALKGSPDPLVKWIAENCEEYHSAAATILKALPATLEELDELAADRDWCSVWDGFRNDAIRAGVISDVVPPTPARKAVFAVIDSESCCRMDAGARRKIGKALDALLQEALAAAQQPAA
ncbi:hypothetical protein ABZY09_30705 [Streptomyces sp. NPDC002928]|uniref:hypothetical protein n=1 Tax=Streptomyces sp. NPDC002928 TaxID=3154440 RepID=UPI0033B05602